MGSSKTTQETKIPEYLEEAGRLAVQQAQQAQQMGFIPYMGPEVAAVNPYEQALAQNVSGMASAFGMAAPSGLSMNMPTVTQGGMTGYSSYPIYQGAMERLREQRPDQYAYFAGQTGFDPITGAATGYTAPAAVQDLSTMTGGTAPASSGGNDDKPNFAPAPTGAGSGSGKLFGGFTSVKDMFDGGGAGASGDTYSSGIKRGPISKAIFGV